MSGIGQVLHDARQRAGVSLAQAAWETRLRQSYLEALERDEADDLDLDPAYVRGTLRTYADYLGLDGETLVARHRAQAAAAQAPRRRRGPRVLATLLTLAVVAVGAFLLGDAWARGRLPWPPTTPEQAAAAGRSAPSEQRSVPAAAEAAPSAAPGGEAVAGDRPGGGAAPSDDVAVLAASEASSVRLKMEMLDEVWVRAEIDGDEVVEGIYDAGQVERLRADDAIAVRLGVGGVVEFTVNGAWYGPLAQGLSGPVDLRCDAAEGCRVVEGVVLPSGP